MIDDALKAVYVGKFYSDGINDSIGLFYWDELLVDLACICCKKLVYKGIVILLGF